MDGQLAKTLVLMAGARTPKDKIEENKDSETNRTEEIPFRLHMASRLWDSLMKFLCLLRPLCEVFIQTSPFVPTLFMDE